MYLNRNMLYYFEGKRQNWNKARSSKTDRMTFLLIFSKSKYHVNRTFKVGIIATHILYPTPNNEHQIMELYTVLISAQKCCKKSGTGRRLEKC